MNQDTVPALNEKGGVLKQKTEDLLTILHLHILLIACYLWPKSVTSFGYILWKLDSGLAVIATLVLNPSFFTHNII